MAQDVRDGLLRPNKRLSPRFFYDDEGSRLFDEITRLPEYYLTNAERSILKTHADDMVTRSAQGTDVLLHVVELGAGTADKTREVLAAVVRHQGNCVYVPIDVSSGALDEAVVRLSREMPEVKVSPIQARYRNALPSVEKLGPRRMVLFIGSSMGNLEDDEAVALLSGVRASLTSGGVLLLGVDRRKDPARMLPAYDDAQGVTARFNLNMLAHLNRVLDGDFDLNGFAHRAVWNEQASRVEMHLESLKPQRVRLRALDLQVTFAQGERIHTECSAKYDDARLDAILQKAGFVREHTYMDDQQLFGVHLCRA